ncbi:adenine phosphoribosyltransferase [Brevibacterium yomogidense]
MTPTDPTSRTHRAPAVTPVSAPDLARAFSLISTTPDFPAPGVLFRDVSPILADPQAYADVLTAAAEPFRDSDGSPAFDLVAGIEARGFVMAGGLAALCGTGVLPIRKAGKLPDPQVHVEYGLEYADAAIEASGDLTGARVLVVDDVLATGGTLQAAHTVVERLGGTVAGSAVLLELAALEGRALVPNCHAVFTL